MGNHNIEFIAAMQSFQYGDKSLTASVELTGNVVSDFHVGMEPSHAEVWPSWRVCGLSGAITR